MSQDVEYPDPAEKTEPELFKQSVHAGIWVAATRTVMLLLSAVRLIVLARLLEKNDFGLMGVALLLIDTLNTFSQAGFNEALIRERSDIRSYLDTAWTTGILRGLLLYALLFFLAPVMAGLKVDPEQSGTAVMVIRTVGLTLIINPLTNIGTIFFTREMRFSKTFIMQTANRLLSILTSIAVAVVFRNVWALVAGVVLGSALGSVLSYFLHAYRPRLRLEWDKFQQMWSFGRWVFVSTVIGFLMTEGDDFFVWFYLGVTELAVYRLAYHFANMPATEITRLINQVSFPAFAKLQDDLPRLKDAFLKVQLMTALITMPVAGLIMMLAPDFVKLFLGDKWLTAAVPMQILSIYGMMRAIGTSRSPLFKAVNKFREIVTLQMLKLVLFLCLLYPLTQRYGIAGTSSVIVIVSGLGQVFGLWITRRVLKTSWVRMIEPLFFPFVATLVMSGVIYAMKLYLFAEPAMFSFGICGFVGAGIYILVILVMDSIFSFGAIKLVKAHFDVTTKVEDVIKTRNLISRFKGKK